MDLGDSWGSLPQDLLKRSINLVNPNFAEGEALRSVNTHWNKTFPSFREGGFKEERPWLLYHETGSGKARFYDPVRERIHNGEDPNLEGARFLGSTSGWLVMADSIDVKPRQQHQTFLYNPFTSQRYNLPPLTTAYPFPPSVVSYGVVTGDPRDEDNTYACLLTDNFHQNNIMVVAHMLVPRLQVYYIAKRNGEWAQNWSVTSIPTLIQKVYISDIKSISPSADKISIIINEHRLQLHTYDFTFQTREWSVSETQKNDPVEWNPFHGQSLVLVKHRLQLPPRNPTTLAIIGTKTDRERVKNCTLRDESDNHSVSKIDGVWIEIRA